MAYYQQPYGAPPQPDLWGWFCAVDTDRSGKIAPKELQKALSNGFSEFNIETVQLLMNMFDRDHSGKITFEEFQNLFGFINQWRGIFMQYDRDRYVELCGNYSPRNRHSVEDNFKSQPFQNVSLNFSDKLRR